MFVNANARREDFVSSQCDQEHIKYLVVGKGGAALVIDFYPKNTDPIELKFCDLLSGGTIQVWGVQPMRRNFINSVKKRDNGNTRDSLLYQYLIKINGDTAQTLQLCSVLEYITFKKDKTSVIKVEDVSGSLYLNTNSELFKTFHDLLDNIFKMGISPTYGK